MQSTPELHFSYFIRSDSVHTDTLKCSLPSAYTLVVDTVNVADTITFVIVADAVLNVVDSLSVTWNHEKMGVAFAVKDEWFIKERTDVPNGHFKFQPYYRGISMPMVYQPMVSGMDTIAIFFRSSTTAYSPVSFTIIQPVK